jgi:hypothetical protein
MPASMVAPERGGSAESPAIHVVLNWIDELKRLVPAK